MTVAFRDRSLAGFFKVGQKLWSLDGGVTWNAGEFPISEHRNLRWGEVRRVNRRLGTITVRD